MATFHPTTPHSLQSAAPVAVAVTARRSTAKRAAGVARLTVLALACALPAASYAQLEAQPKLPTVQLQAGIHLIRAEVADNFAERQAGLMFRDRLGPNEGMLFAFEQPGVQCFWMKNTRIPLTAGFIDDAGRIVNLADMQPFDESSHCSAGPVRYVLEMEQGWFTRHGIQAGSALLNQQIFKPAAH